MADVEVRRLGPSEAQHHLDGLASVLVDCVAGGASIGYVGLLSVDEARAALRSVITELDNGRALLVAGFVGGELVGSVQVLFSPKPNQPHRADLVKLLVHRRARGRGVGRALMERAEAEARAEGKALLVLDTATDEAEQLYVSLGWTRLGVIPNYALYPDGRLGGTIVFFKQLFSSEQVGLLTRVQVETVADGARLARGERVVGLIREGTGRRWVGIYELRPGEVVNLVWSGPSAPGHLRFPSSKGLTGVAVASKATFISNDVANDPRYLMAFSSTGSEMIVPVIIDGQVVGTLDVEDERQDAFGPEDQEFFEALATALRPLFT